MPLTKLTMPIAGAIAVPNGNTYSIVGNTGISGINFPVAPALLTGGNYNVSTTSAGTTFQVFPQNTASQLTICNDSGTKLEIQQGGAGNSFRILDGTYYTFFGITDTNQLGVRRLDQSTTQVIVTARWEK